MKSNNTPNNQSKLEKEKGIIPLLLSVFFITVVSGITTHLVSGFMSWKQFTYLAHLASGIILSLALIIYTVRHFKRTAGVRRAMVLFTGLLSVTLLYLLAGSGIFIIIFSVTETTRWVFTSHTILSYIAILFVFIHLVAHRYTYNKPASQADFRWFITIHKKNLLTSLRPLIVVILSIALLSILYDLFSYQYKTSALIQPYELPYGQHPFRPSQTETSNKTHFVDEKQIAGSNACGTCHKQIFNEWKESIHSQAASDPTYVTNIKLLEKKKGIASTRYCEGCHSPVALLTGQLSKGGKHGGVNGTIANKEGVSCLSCHGIERAVHLKGVASYEFSPAKDYLFASSENFLARKIHNLLIKINPQEHRKTLSRPILKNPELCATCHVQFMDKDMNNWGWIKMQDEYSAWLNSHFSGQSEHAFSQQKNINCQNCHFPKVNGADPSANKQGEIFSHRTLGANTAIPFLNNDVQQLLLTKKFLQSNKVSLSIEKPVRKDATHNSLYIDEKIRAQQETPYFLYLGETENIKLTITNLLVGHNFPGGTTDINQVWVYFRVSDAGNQTIYESGSLNSNKEVDPSAHFYRTVPIDKNGAEVWRHDLFNKTGESYRNVIPAGETDVIEYPFKVPFWAKGPLKITALLKYRKFNQRYARWALHDENIDLPITDVARGGLTIPLYVKPNIEK